MIDPPGPYYHCGQLLLSWWVDFHMEGYKNLTVWSKSGHNKLVCSSSPQNSYTGGVEGMCESSGKKQDFRWTSAALHRRMRAGSSIWVTPHSITDLDKIKG